MEQAKRSPLLRRTKQTKLTCLTRHRARNETAFCEIVEPYASKIYNVPFGILSIHDDEEEIAQEVFAKVHFSVQRFGGRSSL